MKLPDFESLFDAAATEFEVAFRRTRGGVRPDEIGEGREDVLRSFLGEWLPNSYGATHGYVVGLNGRASRQTDVIVFDAMRCPKFIQDRKSDRRLVPLAETFGVIEVKSTLGEKEIDDALEKFSVFSKVTDYHEDGFAGGGEFDEIEVKSAEVKVGYAYGRDGFGYAERKKPEEKDFRDYVVRMRPVVGRRGESFRIVFAYKLAEGFSITDVEARLSGSSVRVDAVFVLGEGYVVKYSQETVARFKSLRRKRPVAGVAWDRDVVEASWRIYSGQSYFSIQERESRVLLVVFYAMLLDLLEAQRLGASNATDLVAVWAAPSSSEVEDEWEPD
ncbi:DUF6602 domain-containing protein [Corallococcus exercitus]|uniref:DUF6602 domain-containing protein n=1 Tax=Corallococcus exercitus TaxID=2316736 RepID=UPI0011C37C17|nr:DUF6602 domain-containing protein [Corallococcus exercitus]